MNLDEIGFILTGQSSAGGAMRFVTDNQIKLGESVVRLRFGNNLY